MFFYINSLKLQHMIIDCICGKKKFRLADGVMPAEGSKVRCGSCSEVWFYHPNEGSTQTTEESFKTEPTSSIAEENVVEASITEEPTSAEDPTEPTGETPPTDDPEELLSTIDNDAVTKEVEEEKERVHFESKISPLAEISSGAFIGKNTSIGDHTIVHPGAVIMDNCSVGNNCEIFPNTTLYPFVELYLIFRVTKGKEDKSRLHERLGKTKVKRLKGDVIWIHAVSVGEANSALILVEELLKKSEQNPDIRTPTNAARKGIEARKPDLMKSRPRYSTK